MQEEMLKTGLKERLIIIVIAAILLISSIAVYVAIIVGGGDTRTAEDKLNDIIKEYSIKQNEISTLLSGSYLDSMIGYKSEVKAFNAEAANAGGLQTRDIVVGDGAEITEENNKYYAYYIGWCPDESIFDSSFNNKENPTALGAPLDVSTLNLIEGWNKGMIGAHIGGVREITMPGELAYGEAQEMCGAYNSPLKFLVMTINPSEEAQQKYAELDEIYSRYVEAYYKYYMTQQDQTSTSDTSSDSSSASGETEASNASAEASE